MPHPNLSNLTIATARDPLTHADCCTSVDAIWGIYKEHTYLESKQEHIPRGRAAAIELVARASGNIRIEQRGGQKRGGLGGSRWRESCRHGGSALARPLEEPRWEGRDGGLIRLCAQLVCKCIVSAASTPTLPPARRPTTPLSCARIRVGRWIATALPRSAPGGGACLLARSLAAEKRSRADWVASPSSRSFQGWIGRVATMGGATQVDWRQRDWRQMAAVKLSTEYDSEGSVFVNKLSARVLNGLAKLTGSVQREPSGDLRYPLLGVVTKYLSVLYDHEDRNALVTMNADVGKNLSVKYLRDIKAQQGEVKLSAHTANLNYKTEISYDVPATALPKVVCTFPLGMLKAEEVELDEERAIALSGFIGGSLLNGQAVASYSDESATFKYTYKDEELTLVPSVSWPQLSPSLAFKRQFGPKNKLSYFHNFENTTWSAVYKYKPVEAFKAKLGYDSDVRLCWGSFWVGKEDSGAKSAPRKCKLQVMLQVPQDDVKSGALLFRLKKRWDVL